VLVTRAIAGIVQVEIIMTSLTLAPADLDGPCSRVPKNDARVHEPCSRLMYTAREHG